MKETTTKIDRATLLKGGGTAALAAVLAGATEAKADACCSPIDLTYTDSPQIAATSNRRKTAIPVKGVLVRKEGLMPDPDPNIWGLIYTVPDAHVNGKDENGKPHGNSSGHSTPLGYNVNIYIMK